MTVPGRFVSALLALLLASWVTACTTSRTASPPSTTRPPAAAKSSSTAPTFVPAPPPPYPICATPTLRLVTALDRLLPATVGRFVRAPASQADLDAHRTAFHTTYTAGDTTIDVGLDIGGDFDGFNDLALARSAELGPATSPTTIAQPPIQAQSAAQAWFLSADQRVFGWLCGSERLYTVRAGTPELVAEFVRGLAT